MTPGQMTLSSGTAVLLEQRPLVGVARVGGLEQDGARLGRPDQIEDVGEVDVAVVRTRVVAPAQVHAQPIGRDVAHGVVEGLDVHRDAAAERRRRPARRRPSGAPWPGPGSRAGPSRRRRRSPRTRGASPRRWRRRTPRRSGSTRCRRTARRHPGDAALENVPVTSGPAHRRRQVAPCRAPRPRRRSTAIGRVAGGRGALAAARVGGDDLGAAGVVGEVGEEVALHRLAAEAVQPILDVGGVARLRHLAVVDDRRCRRRPGARRPRARRWRRGRPAPPRRPGSRRPWPTSSG